MNKFEIVRSNAKGQIVIPKEFRDILGVIEESDLKISILENSIIITPVTGYITAEDDMELYKNLLEISKGAWGKVSKKDNLLEIDRKNFEINESKKAKNLW